MIVELESLAKGRRDVSWGIPPGELDLDEENSRLRSASASVELSLRPEGLSVEGKIDAEIEFDCVRCLEPFAHERSTDFKSMFITEEDLPKERDLELSGDELTFDIFDGVSIDISSVIREQILLDLPAYPVCSAECKGICPTCGVNKNFEDCGCLKKITDPRWDALKVIAKEG